MKVTALLKSTVGDILMTTTDPMGRTYKFDFNKGNNHQLEVPTEMKYRTLPGKEEVFQTNFAQHLLDNCKVTYGELKGSPIFELIEQVEHPVVVESTKVVDKAKAERVKKEKKHEKEVVE